MLQTVAHFVLLSVAPMVILPMKTLKYCFDSDKSFRLHRTSTSRSAG